METQFFKEGDELSTPPPTGEGCDETTAVCQRRHHRRGLGTWVVVATAAFVLCVVLVLWRASSKAEPASAVATPVASYVPPASPAPAPVGEPAIAAVAEPTEVTAPAKPLAAPAESPSGAFAACTRAVGKTALATCQRAFAENPDSADIAVMLAKTEFDRGRARPAIEWAKVAISLDAHRADAYVFLGSAEHASGHTAAAKAAYQRYLQLAPKGRYAGELRGILRSL
jgi:hypothetical protein